MLVRSVTSAPADFMRITAILPRISCSVKFLDPTDSEVPERSTSLTSPESVPLVVNPAAVPRPQPARAVLSAAAQAATRTFLSPLMSQHLRAGDRLEDAPDPVDEQRQQRDEQTAADEDGGAEERDAGLDERTQAAGV